MDVSVPPDVLHGERLCGRLFAQRHEICDLVIARNEFAYYLTDDKRMPPMSVGGCRLTRTYVLCVCMDVSMSSDALHGKRFHGWGFRTEGPDSWIDFCSQ